MLFTPLWLTRVGGLDNRNERCLFSIRTSRSGPLAARAGQETRQFRGAMAPSRRRTWRCWAGLCSRSASEWRSSTVKNASMASRSGAGSPHPDASTQRRPLPADRHSTSAKSSSVLRTTSPSDIWLGRPTQRQAAAATATAVDEAAAHQRLRDLHQVILRDAIALCDLLDGLPPLRVQGQCHQQPQCVIRVHSQAHERNLGRRGSRRHTEAPQVPRTAAACGL